MNESLVMESVRRMTGAAAFAAAAIVMTIAGTTAPAAAAVPGEDAALAAAQEWAKAVVAQDVEAQVKLLPKRATPSPEARERWRAARLHEKEVALINGDRVLSLDVQPATGSGQVGKVTMIVFPTRSVVESKGTKIQRESSVLAFAEEGSSEWSILDGSGQNQKSLRFIVPGYNGSPRIPIAAAKTLKQ